MCMTEFLLISIINDVMAAILNENKDLTVRVEVFKRFSRYLTIEKFGKPQDLKSFRGLRHERLFKMTVRKPLKLKMA